MENLFGVRQELGIFSAYKTMRAVKLWLITEAKRGASAILLPCE